MYFRIVYMDQAILIWFQSFILSAAFSYSDSYNTIFWACEKNFYIDPHPKTHFEK